MKRSVVVALVATIIALAGASSTAHADKRYQPRHKRVYPAIVKAPLRHGHRVNTLPVGALALVAGALYFHAGWYYRPSDGGYVAVTAPPGTTVARLPEGYVKVIVANRTYYRLHNTYYRRDEPRKVYVVVDNPSPPETAGAGVTPQLFVYPKAGQSDEQRAKDRFECHNWAVKESGVDQTNGNTASSPGVANYARAATACLTARGYVVQ